MCLKTWLNNAWNIVGGMIGLTLLMCLAIALEQQQLFSFAQPINNNGTSHNETTGRVFDANSNPYGHIPNLSINGDSKIFYL
ncbi:MAG: hypothetical protein WKF36_06495 [Candidatus Nitrosocosmicus sp.]